MAALCSRILEAATKKGGASLLSFGKMSKDHPGINIGTSNRQSLAMLRCTKWKETEPVLAFKDWTEHATDITSSPSSAIQSAYSQHVMVVRGKQGYPGSGTISKRKPAASSRTSASHDSQVKRGESALSAGQDECGSFKPTQADLTRASPIYITTDITVNDSERERKRGKSNCGTIIRSFGVSKPAVSNDRGKSDSFRQDSQEPRDPVALLETYGESTHMHTHAEDESVHLCGVNDLQLLRTTSIVTQSLQQSHARRCSREARDVGVAEDSKDVSIRSIAHNSEKNFELESQNMHGSMNDDDLLEVMAGILMPDAQHSQVATRKDQDGRSISTLTNTLQESKVPINVHECSPKGVKDIIRIVDQVFPAGTGDQEPSCNSMGVFLEGYFVGSANNDNAPSTSRSHSAATHSPHHTWTPTKPIVRPPFPKAVRDRSLVAGFSSDTMLRVCFRVGEAVRSGREAARRNEHAIIELYARVTSSYRDERRGTQHFIFADLFHDRPPRLSGVYAMWRNVLLWDDDSKVFLDGTSNEKVCRCIGRMSLEGKDWRFTVLNIWEAGWDDVEHVKRIACAGAEVILISEDFPWHH